MKRKIQKVACMVDENKNFVLTFEKDKIVVCKICGADVEHKTGCCWQYENKCFCGERSNFLEKQFDPDATEDEIKSTLEKDHEKMKNFYIRQINEAE